MVGMVMVMVCIYGIDRGEVYMYDGDTHRRVLRGNDVFKPVEAKNEVRAAARALPCTYSLFLLSSPRDPRLGQTDTCTQTHTYHLLLSLRMYVSLSLAFLVLPSLSHSLRHTYIHTHTHTGLLVFFLRSFPHAHTPAGRFPSQPRAITHTHTHYSQERDTQTQTHIQNGTPRVGVTLVTHLLPDRH